MENTQLLMHGSSTLFAFSNVGAALLGAVLGLVVGAVSGIGSLAGMALLPPLIYRFNPTTAIIMLEALYYSNMHGGAFSAILLNILRDSPAICMAMDGYPIASRKKRSGQALFTANTASFIGGTIGIIALTFTGPAPADIGLKFSSSKMMALLLIAMISTSRLMGENPIKGVVITMLGILLASIDMDTLSGSPRYDLGSMHLLGSTPSTSFIIGTAGFLQVIKPAMGRVNEVRSEPHMKLTIRGSLLTEHGLKRLLLPALRPGVMEASVGVLSGAGATTGVFMGYAIQEKFKNEEELRTGTIEGIAVSEAANNAAAAGASAPLLALGIPGSGMGAVFLGGLVVWGLNPGPLLFANELEFTWGLIAPLFLSNIFVLMVAIGVIPFLTQALPVPVEYTIPIITIVCAVGSHSSSCSMYDVLTMFLSGILGYLLVKNDYSTAPMLLSFVLAELLESSIRKTFIIPGGSLSIFFTRPIICMLMPILLVFICMPVIKTVLKKAREKQNNKGSM